MRRLLALCCAGALALVIPCGCEREAPQKTGTTEKFTQSIVSCSPSTTEILFALGVGDRIVAVSTADDYPAAVKDVRKVGGFADPNVEVLIGIRPDLVVSTPFRVPTVADDLRARGMKVLVSEQMSFQDVFDTILKLGEATGAQARGSELIAQLKARVAAVQARAAKVPPDKRLKVFIEISSAPLYTAGRGSFMDEVVTLAGGVNIASGIERPFAKVSDEFVIQQNPDVILIGYMAEDKNVRKEISSRIGWPQVKAVVSGRIIDDIHPDLLCRPGPRLVDGLEALERKLYPPVAAQ